jgi:hypothetical protein
MTKMINRLSTREDAARFTMNVLRNASDWQMAQHALADEPRFEHLFYEDDELNLAQSIIRDAEERLGNRLPY